MWQNGCIWNPGTRTHWTVPQCPTWMLYCPPLSMSVASAFTHFCCLFISDNAFSFNLLWILWTPLNNPHSSPLAAHTIAFSFMAKERQRVKVFGQFYPLARSYPMTQNSSAVNERGFGDTGVLSLSNGDTVSTVPGNQKISRYFIWQKHVNWNLIPVLWQVTILIQQQKKPGHKSKCVTVFPQAFTSSVNNHLQEKVIPAEQVT